MAGKWCHIVEISFNNWWFSTVTLFGVKSFYSNNIQAIKWANPRSLNLIKISKKKNSLQGQNIEKNYSNLQINFIWFARDIRWTAQTLISIQQSLVRLLPPKNIEFIEILLHVATQETRETTLISNKKKIKEIHKKNLEFFQDKIRISPENKPNPKQFSEKGRKRNIFWKNIWNENSIISFFFRNFERKNLLKLR